MMKRSNRVIPGAAWSLTAAMLFISTASAGAAIPLGNAFSYQGRLQRAGSLVDDTCEFEFSLWDEAEGGSQIGATQTVVGVAVTKGLFTVQLNGDDEFGPNAFDGSRRWLQIAVMCPPDASFTTLSPRQALTPSPYALRSKSGQSYANVIVVAASGGEFTSVRAALESISNAGPDNPYLVRMAPGVYEETDLVTVPGHVHLQGSGSEVTVVTSSRAASTPSNAGATLDVADHGRVSDLTIRNTGSGPLGIALYSASTGRDTVIDNVLAESIGSGSGGGRYGIYLSDAEPTIKNSTFKAGGAIGFGSAVNAALGSVNDSGGFPQPLILNSVFLGGGNSRVESCADPTGTGYGLQLSQSSPDIRHSHICGGHRGVALLTNGHVRIQDSTIQVSAAGGAFLFEITGAGSISVASSGLGYAGNKFIGPGVGLRCVHNYSVGTYTPLSNGSSAATACN